MRHLPLLAGSVLLIALPVLEGASLFEEKDKDAASELVLNVEKDREVKRDANRAYVQARGDYLAEKITKFQEDIAFVQEKLQAMELELERLKRAATESQEPVLTPAIPPSESRSQAPAMKATEPSNK